MSGHADADGSVGAAPPEVPGLWALFSAFARIGLLGFGGVAALARHVLVVERRFLSEREFAELFGVSSTLPGANTVNLATILGDRSRGTPGAVAAVAGLLGIPLLVLVVVATLYARFGQVGMVRAGLAGAAAGAAGLVLGTALKILKALDPDAVTLLTAGGVGVAAAFLGLPMLLIIAVAVPLSLAVGAVRRRP